MQVLGWGSSYIGLSMRLEKQQRHILKDVYMPQIKTVAK